MARVYLDHNATTPLHPAVTAAMVLALDVVGNPSSVHAEGRAARRFVDDAREAVARMVACRPEAVTFTSGATESNNMVLSHVAARAWPVAVSATAHASVIDAAPDSNHLPVDTTGLIDLAVLSDFCAVQSGPFIVSIEAINNETGVMQPVEAIARHVHDAEGFLHVDAVQAPGKIALDEISTWADIVTLSAHKFGGPKGVGATVMTGCRLAELDAFVRGGGQERRRRSGTENLVGIAGMGAAADTVAERLDDMNRQSGLIKRLSDQLTRDPLTEIAGAEAPRAGNTAMVMHPAIRAETALIRFDLDGIALSSGSACSSGKVAESHVLAAMGVSDDLLRSGLRISVGVETTDADIDRFLAVWDSHLFRTAVHDTSRAVA